MSPTPAATPAAGTWSRITWRTLTADEPLARIRSITRWRGGFVAVGDPVTADGRTPGPDDRIAHTMMWTSANGTDWSPVDASVLGAASIVVGMAATADGIVALTVHGSDPVTSSDETSPDGVATLWRLNGPLQAWTSTDGRSWTAHPGPPIAVPEDYWQATDPLAWLQPDAAPLVVAYSGDRGLFVSTDGITWRTVHLDGAHRDPRLSAVAALRGGYVAVTDDGRAFTSPDGRTWTKHVLPSGCPTNEPVVIGRTGLIATGILDDGSHAAPWAWCRTSDGRSWHALHGVPPLGVMRDARAQECQGNCPDGALVGDGVRMLAYRGWGDQVGWTSVDGRTWRPLAFDGRPERSTYWLDDQCTGSLEILSVGIRCTAVGDVRWFGAPQS